MKNRKFLNLAALCLFALLIAISGGCKKKVPVAPPEEPPPPPPPPKPTATLSANPTTIQKGKSSTLTWSTSNATNVSINQGVGDVSTSGSRSVSPGSSTTYTLTAKGEGGSVTASARVTVTAPPPPPPKPKKREPTVEEMFTKKVKDIYFDYDKSEIRDDARATLAAASEFLKKYPQVSFTIEGHCDERGSEEYNLGLGDRRANSALSHLTSMGISSSRVKTISYGKERPQCTESNESCWQKNRRAHFVLSR
ncbi:MAG: peptidoglycan-associated lipoprotein Pal [Acidobacteriota bacterium]|nr:peptidoglycan-associated lipoprotein Pal [Acidobacteriota bacterium]